jgi:hypothetical protein
VEQLTLPYRIALLAIALLGVIWFVALRPSSTPTPAAVTAPGVKGLTNAIKDAHGAVAKSDAAGAKTQAALNAADGSTPAASPSQAAKAPAAKTPVAANAPKAKHVAGADRSAAILNDLKLGRVVVVGFTGDTAADDRSVRGALRHVNLHNGKVVVRSVSISDVADYGAITKGVQVEEAPTVLVIDKDAKARTIVGFTDAAEIDQLVADMGGKAL